MWSLKKTLTIPLAETRTNQSAQQWQEIKVNAAAVGDTARQTVNIPAAEVSLSKARAE